MKQEDYDILVIGSGLGGLAAGTLLARRGFKVLMVESRNRIGGRFSTIEHEGFKLPTGAVLIPDGWAIKFFREMGVDTGLFRRVSRGFYRIGGERYEIPPEGGLPMFLTVIDELEREKAEKSGRAAKSVNANEILEGYLKGMEGIKQEGIITVRDWLLQYTENEIVHEVFDNLCAEPLCSLQPMDRKYELQQCISDLKEKFPDFKEHTWPDFENEAM